MIGKLNTESIEEVLTQNIIGRIGCTLNDRAYIVPISYAYDGESIYAHTNEGLKTEMMRKNPNVCFEVDNTEDLSNWKSVIAYGVFEELKTAEERKKGLEQLVNRKLPITDSMTMRHGSEWPFNAQDIVEGDHVNGIIFRIKLTEKTGRYESNKQSPKIVG